MSLVQNQALIYAWIVEHRMTWTDERLDDLSGRVDIGFARVDADLRDLRSEINGLRTVMIAVGGGIMTGLVGVIATLLAQG